MGRVEVVPVSVMGHQASIGQTKCLISNGINFTFHALPPHEVTERDMTTVEELTRITVKEVLEMEHRREPHQIACQ